MSNSLTMTQDLPDTGKLQVNVNSILGSRAIADARIQISDSSEPQNILEEVTTDVNGQTEAITLPAPPLEYSLAPSGNQPYSVFNLRIIAPGFESIQYIL